MRPLELLPTVSHSWLRVTCLLNCWVDMIEQSEEEKAAKSKIRVQIMYIVNNVVKKFSQYSL